MAIAASKFGARIEWTYRLQAPHVHRIDVTVMQAAGMAPDALLPYVEMRSVERGRYRSDPLTAAQQESLRSGLGDRLQVRWLASRAEKWQASRVNARATHIRLSIPEAFTVHQRILDWKRDESPDGVPAKAIGLSPMTLGSMQWVMQKWERAHFMNRFAGGTMVPRLEMDLMPGMMCAAHFMVFQPSGEATQGLPQQFLENGRALQRFWLTASALGLVMQPSLAPLCFSYYAQKKHPFTGDATMRVNAVALDAELQILQKQFSTDELVFMGRIGVPTSTGRRPRSIRKPLSALLTT